MINIIKSSFNRKSAKLTAAFFLLFITGFTPAVIGQTDDYQIKFSGYVRSDAMFDSRQTVSARESHFLLYPANEKFNNSGEDLNNKASLNMLSIQTRLRGKVTGPEAFGAKSSGLIEGEFFGHSDGDINGFRLRHAFVNLDWANTSLLIGQFWNPMFVLEVYPGVVSFNGGVPFQPVARNPQVRITQRINLFNASFTAAFQRDFTTLGPSGASSEYLRNSLLPILDLQLKYIDEHYLLGTGIDFKSIMPRLVTDKEYSASERVNSLAFMAYSKFNFGGFTIKMESIYGENLTDLLMLGGYACVSKDPESGVESYSPLTVFSAWTDLSYHWFTTAGLFIGYTENLGSDKEINGEYYARGNNIKNVFRVSPRLAVQSGSLSLQAELEFTSAAYGEPDIFGKIENSKGVANTRLLMSASLLF